MKTFLHTLHFKNGQEMSYCHYHLDWFLGNRVGNSLEDEFDGDKPYEVVFTTPTRISQKDITRMSNDFEPVDAVWNTFGEWDNLFDATTDEEDT